MSLGGMLIQAMSGLGVRGRIGGGGYKGLMEDVILYGIWIALDLFLFHKCMALRRISPGSV